MAVNGHGPFSVTAVSWQPDGRRMEITRKMSHGVNSSEIPTNKQTLECKSKCSNTELFDGQNPLEFGVYHYWKSFFIAFETYKSRKHRLPNSDTNREKVYNTSNTSKRSISGHLLWWSSRIREKPKLDFLLYFHLFYHRNKTVIIINDI